jgi:UrcA family protein
MINLKHVGFSSAAALALILSATAIRAEPPAPASLNGDSPVVEGKSLADFRYEIVRVTDLNLNHPHGMETLRGRIKAAVSHVCPDAHILDIRGTRAVRDCRSTAFADAMAQVDSAMARTDTPVSEILVAAR